MKDDNDQLVSEPPVERRSHAVEEPDLVTKKSRVERHQLRRRSTSKQSSRVNGCRRNGVEVEKGTCQRVRSVARRVSRESRSIQGKGTGVA